MKVYLAASSHNLDEARWAMAQLRQRGITVTLDWTDSAERDLDTFGVSDDERRDAAHADLDAVLASDAVWVLASGHPTRGMWCEMGAALARGIPVVVSGPQRDACIFAHHDGVTICDVSNVGQWRPQWHGAALDWLEAMARHEDRGVIVPPSSSRLPLPIEQQPEYLRAYAEAVHDAEDFDDAKGEW